MDTRGLVPIWWTAHGQTHPGLRRVENQDRFLVTPTLLAVADGIGGSEGGAVAAQLAIDALSDLAAVSEDEATGREQLTKAFEDADRSIRHRASIEGWSACGTTLTAVALVNSDGQQRLVVAHIGDSRAYLWRRGELHPLTQDHVAELSPEVTAPGRGPVLALTRCLGGGVRGPRPDLSSVPVFTGDRLLVCSDGLIKEAESDLDIAIVRMTTAEDLCESLVTLALNGGGRDNVTVIVAELFSSAVP
jgi:protein phosphatase